MASRPAAAHRDSAAGVRRPSLFLALGPDQSLPWWWEQVRSDAGLCELHHLRLTVRGKKPKEISTIDLPWLFLKVLWVLLQGRRRYEYVFTVENDYNSFAVCFWQSLLRMRSPRHVILSFIMREPAPTLASRAKFALLRFLFASVHKVVVSARAEVAYYSELFDWPAGKAVFVPLITDAGLLDVPTRDDGYVFSGGRVYRDNATLIAALGGQDVRLVFVTDREVAAAAACGNIERRLRVPLTEFVRLMAGCSVVVVSLEDKPFSIGQTVILQAMALGKPVVATRTAATVDYVEDRVTGILVDVGDGDGLRQATAALMGDAELRRRLGQAGRAAVLERHVPHHHSANIRGVLSSRTL